LNSRRPFFVFGALYPRVTGGMEIFNYYFVRHWLEQEQRPLLYWTENSVAGLERHHVLNRARKPIRFFHPVDLFSSIWRNRKQISFVYMGYARTSWSIPFFSALIFRLMGIPYVVTIHSGGDPGWKFPQPYRYYFRHARAVVGVSESICKDYAAAVPGLKPVEIPPLIPFQTSRQPKAALKMAYGIPEADQVLLFVGSLKGLKNPDTVLEAFDKWVTVHPEGNLTLFFAGSGELKTLLEQKASAPGLSGKVKFGGNINREAVPDLYRMADVYCIASDYEGTSLSLLEALYNGLPVLAADSPGLNRMIQHENQGLLFRTRDADSLSEQLDRLLSDKELCKTLGARARVSYEKSYSYSSMIDQYKNLFQSIDPEGKWS